VIRRGKGLGYDSCDAGVMRRRVMRDGEDASRDIGDLAARTGGGPIADYDPAWATRTVPPGRMEKKASLGDIVISSAESTLDVQYQVLHDKPLFGTDVYDHAALAQMLGENGPDCGDACAGQSLPQGFLHAAPVGDLIQTIDLCRTGE